MKIVLTVVLAAIFLAAVWSGYRRGLILSAAQLAAIVVALYGAALLAGLFSDRLLPVAEPFAGGYFELLSSLPLANLTRKNVVI